MIRHSWSPMETDTCPEHGEQKVVGYGSTTGPDPYGISILACGHGVICLGPGDPNVIVSTARPHPCGGVV